RQDAAEVEVLPVGEVAAEVPLDALLQGSRRPVRVLRRRVVRRGGGHDGGMTSARLLVEAHGSSSGSGCSIAAGPGRAHTGRSHPVVGRGPTAVGPPPPRIGDRGLTRRPGAPRHREGMLTPHVLEAEHLTKTYGTTVALDGV